MSDTTTSAREVDKANAEFWDELCGTTMARSLGLDPADLDVEIEQRAAFLGALARHGVCDVSSVAAAVAQYPILSDLEGAPR